MNSILLKSEENEWNNYPNQYWFKSSGWSVAGYQVDIWINLFVAVKTSAKVLTLNIIKKSSKFSFDTSKLIQITWSKYGSSKY